MREDAWLVNVARGDLVETDALVGALASERIGGAALDVTDPEPLPTGHALWGMPQVLITPHVANPPQVKAASLARRVRENTEPLRVLAHAAGQRRGLDLRRVRDVWGDQHLRHAPQGVSCRKRFGVGDVERGSPDPPARERPH